MSITRTITLDDITPEELAAMFSVMNNWQQAAFFNALKPITDEWPGAGWCVQSCDIAPQLDNGGREIIAKLAEHAAYPQEPSA